MIEKDKFLSSIYEINWSVYKGELNENALKKALNEKNIDRLDFTVDSTNSKIIFFLINNGCYISSSKSIYEYDGELDFKSDFIQSAKIEDSDEIANISINNFVLDKYRNDPYLDKAKLPLLYKQWIKNNIKKRCKDVLIYRENNTIHGFLCVIEKPNYYYIELVGVKKEKSSKGVGSALIKAALSKFPEKKKICITQLHNIPMQRLLQKNGFKIKENKYILTKSFLQ